MTKVKTPDDFFNSLTKDIEERDSNVETGTVVEDTVVDEFDEAEEVDSEEEEFEQEEQTQEEDVEAEETNDDDSQEEENEEAEQVDENEVLEFDEETQESEDLNVLAIAKELGWEDVKDTKSFVSKYKEQVSKAQEDAFEGIPDELKEAVKFAKEGGDFMAILDVTSVDYSSVSNKDLVAASVEKYFKLDDGTVDEESLQEWIDSKGKAEIAIMADQIRSQAESDKVAKINAIKANALREKELSNKLLKEELERIDVIGGVKIKQSDRDQLYSDTVSGAAIQELFYENGKISQKKLAENLFKVRKFDKAIQLAKNSAKTEGKREVLSKATNSTVAKKGSAPKPEIKQQSPMDMFYEMISKRK